MSDAVLDRLRDIIQQDVGRRGLKTDPARNLVNAYPDDFRLACRSLAKAPRPILVIVTGFFIPTAQPPAGETDGPLGALFLARALAPLGIDIVIATDDFCVAALKSGLASAGLAGKVPLLRLNRVAPQQTSPAQYWKQFQEAVRVGPVTHLLAIERVGPSHTLASLQHQGEGALGETYLEFLQTVPAEHQDRCHTMRGRDITDLMSPAQWLFEEATRDGVETVGIGDGGNEIGMGKIAWDTIHRNVPGGGLVACRVATNHLIVCGISNWGGYALAAGVGLLRGQPLPPSLFDPDAERRLLQVMVENGPLVDGVTGKPTAMVDGLSFEQYAEALRAIGKAMFSPGA